MKRGQVKDFNQKEVNAELGRVKVTKDAIGLIRTKIDGVVTAKYKPTKRYAIVDFASVAQAFIAQLAAVMNITSYKVDLYGGIQELRLYGEEFKIGNDVYKTSACLLSSTNGLRNLTVNFGVFRQVCSNGMMVREAGNGFSVRHLKTNEDVLKAMQFDFGNMQGVFDGITAKIDALQGKNVKLSTIKKGIVGEDGKNKKKFIQFVSKLLNSKTDRIQDPTAKQVKSLQSAEALLEATNKFDMKIDAYQAFQCYTEIFRSQDSNEIAKETSRILEIVG